MINNAFVCATRGKAGAVLAAMSIYSYHGNWTEEHAYMSGRKYTAYSTIPSL